MFQYKQKINYRGADNFLARPIFQWIVFWWWENFFWC